MSRKYRQRGYQDDDRDDSERSRASGRPRDRASEGPRGRGLGRPQRQEFRCRNCGESQAYEVIEKATTCTRCQAPLHSCVHCAHFDPSARWECRAEIRAPMASKSKANDCELFRPRRTVELGEGRSDDARAAFDALFD